jgi:hypothetical protein
MWGVGEEFSGPEEVGHVIDSNFHRDLEQMVPRAPLPQRIGTIGLRALWPLAGAWMKGKGHELARNHRESASWRR